MPPTRVLIADMPRLKRETVTELLRLQRGVEVVAAGIGASAVREAAVRGQAHVVIIGNDQQPTVRALLEALPRLVVLTVADPERVAWRYGLTPYRERLGDLSPAALTAGIRAREQLPAWWAD